MLLAEMADAGLVDVETGKYEKIFREEVVIVNEKGKGKEKEARITNKEVDVEIDDEADEDEGLLVRWGSE